MILNIQNKITSIINEEDMLNRIFYTPWHNAWMIGNCTQKEAQSFSWSINGKVKFAALITIYLILFTGKAYSYTTINPQIEMYLETPAQNEKYTGVAFVRGWAVAPVGIDHVELDIDGVYNTDIPIGEFREGVGNLYPNYPDSNYSGFNMAFQYSKLTAGAHKASVRAVDTNGQYKEVAVDFYVTRFNTSQSNNFLRDSSKVSLNSATITKDGNEIKIEGVNVDGTSYDVGMSWNTLLQGIAINNISKSSVSYESEFGPDVFPHTGITHESYPAGLAFPSFNNYIYPDESNSFTPDERLFLRIYKYIEGAENVYSRELFVNDGDIIQMVAFIHNNGDYSASANAKNVRFRVNGFQSDGKNYVSKSFSNRIYLTVDLSASNSNPEVIWDTITLISESKKTLKLLVPGEKSILGSNPFSDSNEFYSFTNTGAFFDYGGLIGYSKANNNLHEYNEYPGGASRRYLHVWMYVKSAE